MNSKRVVSLTSINATMMRLQDEAMELARRALKTLLCDEDAEFLDMNRSQAVVLRNICVAKMTAEREYIGGRVTYYGLDYIIRTSGDATKTVFSECPLVCDILFKLLIEKWDAIHQIYAHYTRSVSVAVSPSLKLLRRFSFPILMANKALVCTTKLQIAEYVFVASGPAVRAGQVAVMGRVDGKRVFQCYWVDVYDIQLPVEIPEDVDSLSDFMEKIAKDSPALLSYIMRIRTIIMCWSEICAIRERFLVMVQ